MTYSIGLSEDESYVELRVTGEVSARDMLGIILEAHRLGGEKGISRYLVDVTEARNIDSAANNYAFANADIPGDCRVNLQARVAILASPGDHSHDFAETTMRNAGVNVALFRDRDWAVARLQSSPLSR